MTLKGPFLKTLPEVHHKFFYTKKNEARHRKIKISTVFKSGVRGNRFCVGVMRTLAGLVL